VNRWCLFIVGMGVITVFVNWLQHFYFGIMGEKMTERIRRMMFSGNCNLHAYTLFSYFATILELVFILWSFKTYSYL